MTSGTVYQALQGVDEEIILQFALPGRVWFFGVIVFDAIILGYRRRWRYNRLFWYRSENRFQAPLTPLLTEYSFILPWMRPICWFAKHTSRPLWFDPEKLADRSRDVKCWCLNYESKYVVRVMTLIDVDYLPQVIPRFGRQNLQALE